MICMYTVNIRTNTARDHSYFHNYAILVCSNLYFILFTPIGLIPLYICTVTIPNLVTNCFHLLNFYNYYISLAVSNKY
jgi:hypothetical protein